LWFQNRFPELNFSRWMRKFKDEDALMRRHISRFQATHVQASKGVWVRRSYLWTHPLSRAMQFFRDWILQLWRLARVSKFCWRISWWTRRDPIAERNIRRRV